MDQTKIVITETDFRRLRCLIESARRVRRHDQHCIDELEREVDRAVIVSDAELPEDVVAMNSRVRVQDLDTGRTNTYHIVFPASADADRNRISILAPIGTALLGYKRGATVEWRFPAGMRRMRIVAVE